MRIKTKVVMQMTDTIGEYIPVYEQGFEYDGPLDLCVRKLQQQAQNNAAQAGATAAGFGSEAGMESSDLNPFYAQEMKAQHLFEPGQINELLTAAGAGTGAAEGAIEGQANREAARTHNASGFTKALDEAARERAKTAAGVSEGVAAQDVTGAKQLNQEGAAGMQGLYGTNVGAQLKAMGQQNEDLNTAIEAGKSGWLQNMTGVLGALQGAGMKTASGGGFSL